MRKPKYRAWDPGKQQMFNVMLINFRNGNIVLNNKEHSELWTYLKAIKLMQFTGLKDKNGADIFEGDVVRDLASGKYAEVWWQPFWAGFVISWANDSSLPQFKKQTTQDNLRIIGNIYENTYLVEKNNGCAQGME